MNLLDLVKNHGVIAEFSHHRHGWCAMVGNVDLTHTAMERLTGRYEKFDGVRGNGPTIAEAEADLAGQLSNGCIRIRRRREVQRHGHREYIFRGEGPWIPTPTLAPCNWSGLKLPDTEIWLYAHSDKPGAEPQWGLLHTADSWWVNSSYIALANCSFGAPPPEQLHMRSDQHAESKSHDLPSVLQLFADHCAQFEKRTPTPEQTKAFAQWLHDGDFATDVIVTHADRDYDRYPENVGGGDPLSLAEATVDRPYCLWSPAVGNHRSRMYALRPAVRQDDRQILPELRLEVIGCGVEQMLANLMSLVAKSLVCKTQGAEKSFPLPDWINRDRCFSNWTLPAPPAIDF